MATIQLDALPRTEFGSAIARRMRRAGQVPGVVYMGGDDAAAIAFDSLTLTNFLNNAYGLIDLKVKGVKEPFKCVVKDVQFDPITDQVIHIDFQGVKMGEKMQTTVPLVLKGTPAGTKFGGILSQVLRELDIECFPKDLPDYLEVDISEMNVGDALHVSDLSFENITILASETSTVALLELAKAEISAADEDEEGEEGEEGAEDEAGGDDSEE